MSKIGKTGQYHCNGWETLSGGAKTCAAIVQGINGDRVSLTIFPPGGGVAERADVLAGKASAKANHATFEVDEAPAAPAAKAPKAAATAANDKAAK